MNEQRRMRMGAMLALAAAALVITPRLAAAGNWSVKNVSELVAAINAANQAGGANTVNLAPGRTFTLTAVNNATDRPNGLPVIAANNKLTIHGNGATITRSKAASTPAFRLFDVAPGASLTLEGLTLANGLVVGDTGMDACGGAILNAAGACLTVKCSVLLGNQVVGGDGGGDLGGLGLGGAVWSDGTASFDYVLFRDNQATGGATTNPEGAMTGAGSAFGGAISSRNDGNLTVKNCWFTGNKASGGRLHQPSLYMFDGMGSSGAIDNLNTALVTDSTFTDNQGVGGPADPGVDGGYGVAGAIASASPYASTTVISILRCTFTHNQAIGGDAGPDGIGGLACDGAVANGYAQVASTLTMALCAFTDNQAIGGSGGLGGQAQWGAVGSESPVNSGFSTTATIANCLFANNKALAPAREGLGWLARSGIRTGSQTMVRERRWRFRTARLSAMRLVAQRATQTPHHLLNWHSGPSITALGIGPTGKVGPWTVWETRQFCVVPSGTIVPSEAPYYPVSLPVSTRSARAVASAVGEGLSRSATAVLWAIKSSAPPAAPAAPGFPAVVAASLWAAA